MLLVATEICLLATRMCCRGTARHQGPACPLLPSLLPPCCAILRHRSEAGTTVLGTTGTQSGFFPPGQVVFTRTRPAGDAPSPSGGSCFGAAAAPSVLPPAQRGLGTPPPGRVGTQSTPGGFGHSQAECCLPLGWLWALPGAVRGMRELRLSRGWSHTRPTALNPSLLHQQATATAPPVPGHRGSVCERGHLQTTGTGTGTYCILAFTQGFLLQRLQAWALRQTAGEKRGYWESSAAGAAVTQGTGGHHSRDIPCGTWGRAGLCPAHLWGQWGLTVSSASWGSQEGVTRAEGEGWLCRLQGWCVGAAL